MCVLLRGTASAGTALLTETELDTKLRELVILRITERCDDRYAWVQHASIARAVGVIDSQIAALEWREIPLEVFDVRERVTFAFVDEVVDAARAKEDTFAAMRRLFSSHELLELPLLIGCGVMTTLEVEVGSPFGEKVLELVSETGQEVNRKRLWIMSSDGSKPTPLPDVEGTYVFGPQVTPNGEIFYGSDRSGTLQIWKMDLDVSNATQLTTSNDIVVSLVDAPAGGKLVGHRLSISFDAKTVAYTYSDTRVNPLRGVVLVPLEGESKVTLLDIPVDCVRWTRDGSLLYSTTQEGILHLGAASRWRITKAAHPLSECIQKC